MRDVQLEHIDVDTPDFTDKVVDLVMHDPLYDLTLRSIAGVRESKNPDPNWSISDLREASNCIMKMKKRQEGQLKLEGRKP